MDVRAVVDAVGLAVDGLGVGVIVAAIVIAGVAFARRLAADQPISTSYRQLRQSIGRGILLGLELLVAGDIIRTVVVAPTFASVGVLAMIVAIRTFLSFSLDVELTGRWPWQGPSDAARRPHRGSRGRRVVHLTCGGDSYPVLNEAPDVVMPVPPAVRPWSSVQVHNVRRGDRSTHGRT
jgi:uncharacterized membrane protein